MPYEVVTRVLGGKLTVKMNAETMKELFLLAGELFEVLGGDEVCGKCGSQHIFPRSRKAGNFTYYEIACGDCQAKLSFGQNKDMTHVWPKRTADNGDALPNRGWSKFQAIAAPKDEAPQESRSAPTASARNAPQTRQTRPAHPPDPPALVEMLKDPTEFEKVIGELFYAMVDANGEVDDNRPKSDQVYQKMQADRPHDKELIRRLFHYKIGDWR